MVLYLKRKKDGMMTTNKTIIALAIAVAILNIFDGYATSYGLLHNIIEELNPIMDFIINCSPNLFILLKIALSFLILFISYLVYKGSSQKFKKTFMFSLAFVCMIYVGIIGLHFTWLSMI